MIVSAGDKEEWEFWAVRCLFPLKGGGGTRFFDVEARKRMRGDGRKDFSGVPASGTKGEGGTVGFQNPL